MNELTDRRGKSTAIFPEEKKMCDIRSSHHFVRSPVSCRSSAPCPRSVSSDLGIGRTAWALGSLFLRCSTISCKSALPFPIFEALSFRFRFSELRSAKRRAYNKYVTRLKKWTVITKRIQHSGSRCYRYWISNFPDQFSDEAMSAISYILNIRIGGCPLDQVWKCQIPEGQFRHQEDSKTA